MNFVLYFLGRNCYNAFKGDEKAMWKLIVLLLLAVVAAFVGVSEHKRREKARARAQERR